jgi:hypothetical protein
MKIAIPYKLPQSAIESMPVVSNVGAQQLAIHLQYGPIPTYPSDRADYVPPNGREPRDR